MERIARVIAANPKRVLAVTGLITLLAVISLFRISFNADVASFLTEGNERGEQFAALQDKYATADPVNVVLSLPEGAEFTERDNLVTLVEFRNTLSDLDGVAAITTVIPEQSPLDGSALTPELIRNAPQPILDALTTSPLSEFLLSADAQHALLLVVPEDDGIALARAIPDVPAPIDTEVTVAGNPAVYAAVVDILSWFLLAIPPMVIGLLLLTFYTNIGDRRMTVLAVIPALLGSLWTFGFIAAIGRPIDIVTVIVPIFVLVMGSADGLHFVTHFQDVGKETEDPVARITSTLRQVGVPMILTTVSTAVGFLSLLAADIGPIRQLGMFAAIGISFAGVISFFSLPAIMVEVGKRQTSAREPLIGTRVTKGLRWLVVRRWSAPAVVGVVAAFGAIFIPQLEVDSDPLFMFSEDHEVRQAFATTEELFGGATPLVGEFAFDRADPSGSLLSIASASAELEALPGVRSVFSAADIVASLPGAAAQAALTGQGNLPVDGFVSDDGFRFLLFPTEFTSSDLRGWLDFADSNESVTIITGLPVLWDELARLIVGAQVWSVVAALALVGVMLFLTYRKLRPTLVALIPLLLTITALLGFIAASGIQLNLITAVASSIVIGVGIDYAIHFVAAIDHARDEGDGYVLRAIDRAGRPIVANALGIAIAMTALLLSPLRPHHHISGIMWISMSVAALSALLVIPALLPRDGLIEPTPEHSSETPIRA